jgi:hypothetical protein
MEYLGYTVSNGKISVSSKKFEAVKDRPLPTTQKEGPSYVRFCDLYAKFTHHFIDLMAPLMDLKTNEIQATEGYADAYMIGSH